MDKHGAQSKRMKKKPVSINPVWEHPEQEPDVRMPEMNQENQVGKPYNLKVQWTKAALAEQRAFGIDAEEELASAAVDYINNIRNVANSATSYLNTIVSEYPLPEPNNTIYYQQPVYSHICNGIYDNGDITFNANNNKWFMKITNKGEIKFNTEDFPNITADEQAKLFLEALKRITHMDGKQYTFDF